MEIRRCINCMDELPEGEACCPACGMDNQKIEQPAYALRCNSILHGRYLMGRVLGQGGFGITYIGMDMVLNVKVAVKEYFPMGMVTRESGESSRLLWNTAQAGETQRQNGYDSFLKEARKMAKIDQIPSIVRVRDMFLDNETAYIVMDFVEGVTLKKKLLEQGPMAFSECIGLLRPMMEDLAKVHKQNMVHRDISPDNLMIQPDGTVRLLDLGAAKDMTAAHGPASQLVAKKGFSPFEQYMDGGKIGPWTDVYALCATIYYCITGKLLPDALERIDRGEVVFPDTLKETLPENVKQALEDGLKVRAEERIQDVEELLRQLDAAKPGQEENKEQEYVRTENREREYRQAVDETPVTGKNAGIRQAVDEVPVTGKNAGIRRTVGNRRFVFKWMKKKRWAVLGVCLLALFVFIVMSPDSQEETSFPSKESDGQTEGFPKESSVGSVREEPQSLPVMKSDTVPEDSDYSELTVLGSNYKRDDIVRITFLDTLENKPEDAWDVSAAGDGTVMAWVGANSNNLYDLYIGGKGGVRAPAVCAGLFLSYDAVKEINFNGNFDTSQVTDMFGMFAGCYSLEQLDVGNFDTSQVTDMSVMFQGCMHLKQLDLSSFNTAKVTSMAGMFWQCTNLTQLNVGSFDTSQVRDMSYMFADCKELKELDLTSFTGEKSPNETGMFNNCDAKLANKKKTGTNEN